MQELINHERRLAGLGRLELDTDLCELASLKAEDMRSEGYFGHCSKRLGSMTELVEKKMGERKWIGENIACNFPDEETVHQAWMSSPLHRKNILDKNYDCFGFAHTDMGAGRIYVQIFTGRS